jgi:transposase
MRWVAGRRAESPKVPPVGGREDAVIKLGELVMILDLHRQGLSVSAIARQVGVDRKPSGIASPEGWSRYKKRAPAPCAVDRFEPYLRERLAAYPALTARRLFREIKGRGFAGGYGVVRRSATRPQRRIRSALRDAAGRTGASRLRQV